MKFSKLLSFRFYFALLLVLHIFPQVTFAQNSQQNVFGISTSSIFALTNDDRSNLDLKIFKYNVILEKAAQMKADDMASKEYFSHNTPDGKKPWYWFTLAGYKYAYAGENLATFFSNPNDIENAWMKSPAHKANIVNTKYAEVGIGIAHGTYQGKETVFVVQLFGTQVK